MLSVDEQRVLERSEDEWRHDQYTLMLKEFDLKQDIIRNELERITDDGCDDDGAQQDQLIEDWQFIEVRREHLVAYYGSSSTFPAC